MYSQDNEEAFVAAGLVDTNELLRWIRRTHGDCGRMCIVMRGKMGELA